MVPTPRTINPIMSSDIYEGILCVLRPLHICCLSKKITLWMKWQGPRSKSEPQRISLMMADDDGTSLVARIASRRGRYCDKSALWWLKPWSQQCQLHSHKYTAIFALNIALFLYKEIWCTLHIPHRTIIHTYILVYCDHDAMKSLSTTSELRYTYIPF